MRKLGIDVSTFQGNINWPNVKTSNIEFAMLRGGYGRYELDDKFIKNYLNAKAVDMPIGVYHYSYATDTSKAKQEANFVINYLKDKKLEYPIAYDVEEPSQIALSKSELTKIIDTFCSTIEKAGYYVIIYTSKYVLENKLDVRKLKKYDIWVAQWNDKCTYKGNYGMWQFSDACKVKGIVGRVDMDYAYKDYPAIIKKNHLNGWVNTVINKPKLEIGKKILLQNVPIYADSKSKKSVGSITGTFYLYDANEVNGRYRITNSLANCGKSPVGKFVTGWIDKKFI